MPTDITTGEPVVWYKHPDRRCIGRMSMFFPPDREYSSAGYSTIPATTRCCRAGGCPVLWECLDAAIAEGDVEGVRGGTAGFLRRPIIRALRDEFRAGGGPGGRSRELMARTEQLIVRRGATARRRPWDPDPERIPRCPVK